MRPTAELCVGLDLNPVVLRQEQTTQREKFELRHGVGLMVVLQPVEYCFTTIQTLTRHAAHTFPEMRCDGIVCAPRQFREELQECRGSLAGTARGDVDASRP